MYPVPLNSVGKAVGIRSLAGDTIFWGSSHHLIRRNSRTRSSCLGWLSLPINYGANTFPLWSGTNFSSSGLNSLTIYFRLVYFTFEDARRCAWKASSNATPFLHFCTWSLHFQEPKWLSFQKTSCPGFSLRTRGWTKELPWEAQLDSLFSQSKTACLVCKLAVIQTYKVVLTSVFTVL